MTYNAKSQTMSIRINRDALAVLEWHAALKQVPLRTFIRQWLQERAEQITDEYRLDVAHLEPAEQITPPPDSPDPPTNETPALSKAPESNRLDEFTARLAQAFGVPADDLANDAVVEPDGTLLVSINGVEFTDPPDDEFTDPAQPSASETSHP